MDWLKSLWGKLSGLVNISSLGSAVSGFFSNFSMYIMAGLAVLCLVLYIMNLRKEVQIKDLKHDLSVAAGVIEEQKKGIEGLQGQIEGERKTTIKYIYRDREVTKILQAANCTEPTPGMVIDLSTSTKLIDFFNREYFNATSTN